MNDLDPSEADQLRLPSTLTFGSLAMYAPTKLEPWQLAWVDNIQPDNDGRLAAFLTDGWEPFAASPLADHGARMWFRRRQPSEG